MDTPKTKRINSIANVLSSKMFRRLVGKTQLFSPNKKDHFYNRLTHSLEVLAVSMEIAKRIERKDENVLINHDVLSIIALCHDFGHTPFGHEGERTLNKILYGEDNLDGLIPERIIKSCFKHNIYSAKLYLRAFKGFYANDDYTDAKIIDGIMKHTKPFYEKSEDFSKDYYGIDKIVSSFKQLKSIKGYSQKIEPISLEGSIVAIADEIAQRCSDSADALTSKTIMLEEFIEKLPDDLFKKGFKKEKIKNTFDIERVIRYRLVQGVRVKGSKVFFNERTKKMNEDIEHLIMSTIQESYQVRFCDSKNSHVIRQTYKAFFRRPEQLDDKTLSEIFSDLEHSSANRKIKKECFNEECNKINFSKLCKLFKNCLIDLKGDNPKSFSKKVVKVFMQNIAYYMAGMTDKFLIDKYKKLYSIKEM